MSTTDQPPADHTPEHGAAAEPGADAPYADSGPADATVPGTEPPNGDPAGPAPDATPGGGPDDGGWKPWDNREPRDAQDAGPAAAREPSPLRPAQQDADQVETLEAYNSALAHNGNAITLNVGTSQPAEFQRMTLDATETARLHRLHQQVPRQERMADSLRVHHLVVLTGPKGSGREQTGRVLLADRCGSDRLSVLHGEEARLTQALIERNGSRLRQGHGVRVNVGTRSPGQATLEALRLRARERGAYVVLIVEDARTDPGDLGPYAVHHTRPQLAAVLEAHLKAELAEHRTQCTEPGGCTRGRTQEFTSRVLADPRVDGTLAAASSVHWVARFARDLVSCLHGPEEALDTLLDTPHGDLRSLVRRFLKLSEPAADPGAPSPAADPHQQALRITYVLGHNLPLSDVIRAGTLLSGEVLRAENRDTAPTRPVFEADLDHLVPPGKGIAAEPGAGISDNPRRARLSDPELMPAVIEVIWHDLPWLREPLVGWLKRLGSDGLERVRARAAVIAGHLLRHDFDSVYRYVVKFWALSRSVNDRRCASLALAVALAADDPWLTERVDKQVADWAGSPRTPFQDSAARAYGTPVGTRDVPGTLPALQALAGRPALVPYASVAYSTAALYLAPDGADPVAEALGRWIRSSNDNLPRHAVRTLLVLGPFAVGPELAYRPTLAQQAMNDPEREETLLLLWQRALIDPAHSGQAWQLLRQWLLAADEDEELAAFLEKFGLRICVDRLLSRAVFHLRCWARQQPEARCVAQLLRSLGGA
ncbi:hypothetical protein ACH4U5_03400 [Streptomyces sp. NPDC020858]|uniref:hypothetical protein n=1 Tax=Streptomyces sp. NPDC020858 TaxID=3365097 RepID=UPI0037B0684D